jgi:poly(beta-D-mannuronate) lyase
MNIRLLAFLYFSLFSLFASARCLKVNDIADFNKAVKTLLAGDSLVLANRIWKDAQLIFKGKGEENRYISLIAETPGKVILEGTSSLQLSGEWLWVSGLVFTNGHTPKKTVIDFRTGTREYAYNAVLSNCVIDKYNQSSKTAADHWVELWGKNNRVEYCYFGGKTNEGTTLVIWPNDSNSINNHHLVQHNYFGARPPLGVNGGETIRIGTSDVCNNVSASIVRNNYFEHCNGEVEIISNKSCDNKYLNNTFYECEGCLTLRHGNRAIVAGNWFIGNNRKNTGGVRIINEGHRIYNNVFYQLRGEEFFSALSIMNAIPNSPANGYAPVKDVIVAYNTFYDCSIPWNFCAGARDRNRTVVPESTQLINNLVYCPNESSLFVSSDNRDGIFTKNNLLIYNKGFCTELGSVIGEVKSLKIHNIEMVTTTATAIKVWSSTDDNVTRELNEPVIGAFLSKKDALQVELASSKNCGPQWYNQKE